jgi:hypothetical protein
MAAARITPHELGHAAAYPHPQRLVLTPHQVARLVLEQRVAVGDLHDTTASQL